MSLARVEGLSVDFSGTRVIDRANLSVPQDGVTMLLGRSGSGKTTFLRAFNRLNESFSGATSTGALWLRLGHEMHNIYDAASFGPQNPDLPTLEMLRRRVGMVFQNPNLLPMSIERNVLLPLQVHALGNIDTVHEKMEEALVAVNLWGEVRHRLGEPAHVLSGGQQQRLCLARALVLEPEILLLDEPTASLDPAGTASIEQLIGNLAREYGMLMVSHGLEQARRLGTSFIAFPGNGKVEPLDEHEARQPGLLEKLFEV